MDAFLDDCNAKPSGRQSHSVSNVSAADKVKQNKSEMFEDGGVVWPVLLTKQLITLGNIW